MYKTSILSHIWSIRRVSANCDGGKGVCLKNKVNFAHLEIPTGRAHNRCVTTATQADVNRQYIYRCFSEKKKKINNRCVRTLCVSMAKKRSYFFFVVNFLQLPIIFGGGVCMDYMAGNQQQSFSSVFLVLFFNNSLHNPTGYLYI